MGFKAVAEFDETAASRLSKAQRDAIIAATVEYAEKVTRYGIPVTGVSLDAGSGEVKVHNSGDRLNKQAEAARCEQLADTVREQDMRVFYRGRAAELRKELGDI